MKPSVTMVCLYADRPQFIGQILDSFRGQTYEDKWLLIYDNGLQPFAAQLRANEVLVRDRVTATIGDLRNNALGFVPQADVIAHLDSDDWSHSARISEQVHLLETSGAEVVGYNDMLFWRTPPILEDDQCRGDEHIKRIIARNSEAWLYSNKRTDYAVGSSLCFWHRVWEGKHFPALPVNPSHPNRTPEDSQWLRGFNVCAVSSLADEPRMIARIHAGNAAAYSLTSSEWQRTPSWDSRINVLLG